jgi:hypothetical protein
VNTKLHILCDKQWRPIRLPITEGQRSDFNGADVLLNDMPKAETLLGEKLWQQQNPKHAGWSGNHTLHSAQEKPKKTNRILQDALQNPP